ncbi:hypothetical protein KM043_005750 [Ampulex compressa]|nr:hypothetical protein KM043_005750 [Ampulex compressa]
MNKLARSSGRHLPSTTLAAIRELEVPSEHVEGPSRPRLLTGSGEGPTLKSPPPLLNEILPAEVARLFVLCPLSPASRYPPPPSAALAKLTALPVALGFLGESRGGSPWKSWESAKRASLLGQGNSKLDWDGIAESSSRDRTPVFCVPSEGAEGPRNVQLQPGSLPGRVWNEEKKEPLLGPRERVGESGQGQKSVPEHWDGANWLVRCPLKPLSRYRLRSTGHIYVPTFQDDQLNGNGREISHEKQTFSHVSRPGRLGPLGLPNVWISTWERASPLERTADFCEPRSEEPRAKQGLWFYARKGECQAVNSAVSEVRVEPLLLRH